MRWVLQNKSTGTVIDTVSNNNIFDQKSAEEYFIGRKQLEPKKFFKIWQVKKAEV
tara:strand:+ start:1867 stop:2031 length:165 start_codon:yes stop_codon:yes gene_type:complete